MWTAVELRELRIFLALAEELHFGQTAERLQISQPGVSDAIRNLEARIGGRLFERTSRRVSLTPAGDDLRHNLIPALAALDRALAQASDHAASVAGPLRIGFTSTTDGPPLHRLIDAFQSRHPDCQVILHEVDSGDPYAAVRRGDVDLLVNWLAVDEPDLTAGPAISLHSRLLVVARSHRLATRTSVLIEDLADEQVALLPPSFPAALYDAILPPRTPSGRPIARTQPVRSINEIAAHVAHGRIGHVTMTRRSGLRTGRRRVDPYPGPGTHSTRAHLEHCTRERQDPRPRRSRPRHRPKPGSNAPQGISPVRAPRGSG